mgnify:CR=1 FL=1|tara:strand:+ start:8765 stop:9232 length:468 start_codon:yes stop_codon:yes gene_type:complete
MNIPKFVETTRLVMVIFAFTIMNSVNNNAVEMLHFLVLWMIVPLAGLTGLEGMFFSRVTAQSAGRAINNPYQKQSAANNLALAITALIVWVMNWGVTADATIMIATLCFFSISACVHTWEAIKLKNYRLKNLFRPIWTLALLGVCLPVLIEALLS